MADVARGSGERVRLLTETYRTILGRYEEIERLSRREQKLLRDRRPVTEVNVWPEMASACSPYAGG